MTMTPVLLIGAGRMGGAILEGWRRTSALRGQDILICDPHPGSEAMAASQEGASLNPPDDRLGRAQTVLLAVKPQVWRETAAACTAKVSADAVIVSVVAGVRLGAVQAAFGGRAGARVMPITAVATGRGVASIHALDPHALARAHALFDPIATSVEIEDEALMDAATAVSGSSPAYLYAFVEALEQAGRNAGLPAATAEQLARATIAGAARLMQESGVEPAELRRQVTSPKGVTEAALKVLMGPQGFEPLLDQAVQAAIARSRELGGD